MNDLAPPAFIVACKSFNGRFDGIFDGTFEKHSMADSMEHLMEHPMEYSKEHLIKHSVKHSKEHSMGNFDRTFDKTFDGTFDRTFDEAFDRGFDGTFDRGLDGTFDMTTLSRWRAFNACQSCEVHAFIVKPQHLQWLSCRSLLGKTQQESPGCPAVAIQDQAVRLTAKHAEHRGLLRSHELADANAKGAVQFSLANL